MAAVGVAEVECDSEYSLDTERIRFKVIGVFGTISETNVPVETFVQQEREGFTAIAVSFNQNQQEVREFLRRAYPGVPVKGYGLGFKESPVRALTLLFRLLKKCRPDLIHLHHSFSAFVVSVFVKIYFRCLLVVTLHNDFRRFRRMQKLWLGTALLSADLVVCNSESTRRSLGWVGQKLFRRKLRVCYNGVDGQAIEAATKKHPAAKFRQTNDAFVIGWVGRLIPQKDVGTLLKGYAVLSRKVPKTRLIVAGEGELREQHEAQAKMLGVQSSVDFTGLIQRSDVYRLLAEVDVIVISSKWEGFCNAMVEAMYAGKPVVATGIDVLEEVLGAEYGRFFKVGCDGSLAKRLVELCQNAELRKCLGGGLRERAASRFGLESSVSGYAECYRELLQGKSEPA